MKILVTFAVLAFLGISARASDLKYAPSAFEVDGVKYTSIDIQSVNASWTFEQEDQWSGSAKFTFQVKQLGNPVILFSPEAISEIKLGSQTIQSIPVVKDGTKLRALQFKAKPGRTYTLYFNYQFKAQAGEKQFYFQNNYWEGRSFEQYIPSNMLYDNFKLNLKIDIRAMTAYNEIVANGKIRNVEPGIYRLDFPAVYNGGSFFVDLIQAQRTPVLRGQYKGLPVIVYQDPSQTITEEELQETLTTKLPATLEKLESLYGPFPYSSVIVKFASDLFAFAGGITYSHRWDQDYPGDYFLHELGHSWFLRGVRPVNGAEVWIGEGFGTWLEQGSPRSQTLFNPEFKNANFGCSGEYSQLEQGNGHWGGMAFLGDLDKMLETRGGVSPILKQVFLEKKFQAMSNKEFKHLLEQKTGLSLEALFDWYIIPTAGCPAPNIQ
jgi:hypothetical protein